MALNDPNRPGLVITPKEDLSFRIDESKRKAEELSRKQAQQRRQEKQRRIATLVVLLIVLGGVIWLGSRWLRKRPAASIQVPHSNEATVGEISQSVFSYGKLIETKVSLASSSQYEVRIFDFDVYYYLQGEDRVLDETLFLNVLTKYREVLGRSWVVVFAGASFEGDQWKNLDLCRRRVSNIANLMVGPSQLRAIAYWGMPAGEFRFVDLDKQQADVFTGDSSKVEDDEEVAAQQLSIEELRTQRRLLVVAIGPLTQPESGKVQTELNSVMDALTGRGLFPIKYDYGRARPAPIDSP